MKNYLRNLCLSGALIFGTGCYSTAENLNAQDPAIRKLVDGIKGTADQMETFYNLVPDKETKDEVRKQLENIKEQGKISRKYVQQIIELQLKLEKTESPEIEFDSRFLEAVAGDAENSKRSEEGSK